MHPLIIDRHRKDNHGHSPLLQGGRCGSRTHRTNSKAFYECLRLMSKEEAEKPPKNALALVSKGRGVLLPRFERAPQKILEASTMLPKSTSGDPTVAHTPLAAHYPRPAEYTFHYVMLYCLGTKREGEPQCTKRSR